MQHPSVIVYIDLLFTILKAIPCICITLLYLNPNSRPLASVLLNPFYFGGECTKQTVFTLAITRHKSNLLSAWDTSNHCLDKDGVGDLQPPLANYRLMT